MSSPRWFQRRRIGLGWRPASWQGWLITLLAVAGIVLVLALLRGSSARVPLAILILAAYAVVALATGASKLPAVAPPVEPSNDVESQSKWDRRMVWWIKS